MLQMRIVKYNIICNRDVSTNFLACSRAIGTNNETCVVTCATYIAYVCTVVPLIHVRTYVLLHQDTGAYAAYVCLLMSYRCTITLKMTRTSTSYWNCVQMARSTDI